MVVRNRPRLAVLSSILALACGDTRDEGTATSIGTAVTNDASSGSEGSDPSDESDEGESEAGSEAGDSGVDESDSGGPSAEHCEFAAGCHMPSALQSDRGVASHVQIGCGGDAFRLATSLSVAAYADPEAPRSVPLLADVDGDGNVDLVVNFRKASVGLAFHGNGDGTFDPTPGTLAGGIFAGGWGGDLGDIDGDGALDVVFGDHARGAWAWRNTGALSFSESRSGLPDGPLFAGAGLGDLDGDGTLDALFGADQFSSGVYAMKGGGGTWSALPMPVVDGASIGDFAFGDLDGDGDLDAVGFGRGTAAIDAHVLVNDGAGALAQSALLGGGGTPGGLADPVQGALGDVDCDGDLDIAAGGTIQLGDAGTFAVGASVDVAVIAELADMTGDGHLDLVTHDAVTGLAVYVGDGSGTAFASLDAALPDASYTIGGVPLDTPYGIAVADLDGSGALDIVRIGGFGAGYWVESWVR
ncbi:MAG TPA: VCBS repeat-containing protein [Nannocystaceae bacterium]|nr:VCBS repeat-containing protein [Nannocystaceae bacterium]